MYIYVYVAQFHIEMNGPMDVRHERTAASMKWVIPYLSGLATASTWIIWDCFLFFFKCTTIFRWMDACLHTHTHTHIFLFNLFQPSLSFRNIRNCFSKLCCLWKPVMWCEQRASSSVFNRDRTLYCVSGLCPGGQSWRGYSAVNSVYSSTLSLLDKWELRLIPTLHATTHLTQHFNAQAKNRPDFFSFFFKDNLTSFYCKTAVLAPLASCLLYWFSANQKKKEKKKVKFSTPTTTGAPQGWASVYLLRCW